MRPLAFTLAFGLAASAASLALADEVTLKGGIKLEGKILTENDEKVVLRLRGGGKTTLLRKRILSIKRSKSSQGEKPAKPKAGGSKGPSRSLPALGKPTLLEPGVEFHDLTYKQTRLWIYRPRKRTGRLPLVLIAPAGSRMIHGMSLSKGDRPEHMPYVRAGLCVVSYSVAGHVPQKLTDASLLRGVRQFLAKDGGLDNARAALDYASAKLSIDAKRVYAVGHSSAATLALQFAAAEPRVKAVVAYAACTKLPRHLGTWLATVERAGAKGVTAYVKRTSPHARPGRIKVPLFLFQAADDKLVPIAETQAFARAVKATNRRVSESYVTTGGHYQPMIQVGVPRAIRWLKALP